MHQSGWRRFAGTVLSLLALLVSGAAAHAQDAPYTIRGVVVDAVSQQPLSGVSVSLRTSGIQTVTNANGVYTLRAQVNPGTYTLQISRFDREAEQRQVTLGANRTVEVAPVALQQATIALEGIVVTGTGVAARRVEVANTVATVSGEAVSAAPGASTVDQALQGKITGAVITENSGQPGGGVSIRLRGTSTILGGGEPLIVVDGIIVDNNDAALISLGANAGRGSAALTNRLADIAPGDIDRIEVLKGAAAAALYGSRANNGVVQIFTKRGRQGAPQVTFRTEASLSRTADTYDLLMYPFAGPADAAFVRTTRTGQRIVVGEPVERFDVQDEIFRTGLGTGNQLSVAGGNEGTQYYLSGVYNSEEGIIQSTGYEKKSARASITQRVTDNLQVIANANFVETETNLVPEGEQTEGALTNIIFQPTSFNPAFDPQLNRFPYSFLGANPLNVLRSWKAPEDVTRFFGNVETSWTPIQNVTLRYFFGLDDYRQESTFSRPPQSISTRDVGLILNPVRFSRQLNSDFTATHEARLNAALGFNTTAGFRYTSDRGEVIASSASDLPPFQRTVGGANLSTGQSISEIRTVGGFVQERLGINDRVFLTAGLNVEGSSAFGADERYQLFPRVGVSWLVDEEPLWSGMGVGKVLSTLRLRAAYGETGGQPPSAYGRFDNFFNLASGGLPGLLPSSLAGNPNLKPERQREYEAGFEAGFLADRALVEFTYYNQRTEDLVLSVPLPLSSGFTSQLQNIGEISNRGVEIALNTQNIVRPNFSWTSRLQYSANRNRVEKLVTAADTLVFGYLNAVVEGQPVGVFYGRGYRRDEAGEIVIDPATGLGARSSQFTLLGDPNPDFTGAFSNVVTWGGLQLNVLFDGQFGNDVANFTRRITEYFGSDAIVQREIEALIAKRTDPSVVVPKYSLNVGRISNYEEYVEDGSYVKLREIALSYTLGQPWVRRMGPSSIELRLAGRNLYTWTDYSGLDPEINLFANNTVARGVDFAVTPIPRQFILGATFNF